MPKLHLVGITPDHRGLVLSEHARAKRGDMVLEIDERLLEAIDKAQRLRTAAEGQRLESNALPTKREANGEDIAVRLTPREIQQRLRAGETVTALARSSGTDEAWIRRFAAPVLAEKARVIDRARSATFNKRGLGPSAAALGPAVAANVIDKGVPLTLPDLEAGWGAYQHPEGGWHVTFTFPLRGRRQTAEWEVDPETGDLAARNKLGTELAWRESAKKLPQPKPVKAPAAKKPAATKAASASPPPPDTKAASASPPPPDTAPADEAATTTEPVTVEPGAAPAEDTVQALPLTSPPDRLEPGEVREVSLRKPRKPPAAPTGAPKEPARSTAKARPAAKERPTAKDPATKRAAAAITETPAQSVVTVPPPEESSPEESSPEESSPEESTPPTDLDVVDVVVDLRSLDETAPEPAPIGSPPAPQGGPPAS